MKTGIYKIECKSNNRIYVGQSVNVDERLRHHLSTLRKGNHQNCYLQRSFKKYGESSFSFNLLEECDESLLNNKEAYWISKLNSTSRRKGFNLAEPDGKGKYRHSDRTCKKISKSKTGSVLPQNVRDKIRDSLKEQFNNGALQGYLNSIKVREISVTQYDMQGNLLKKWDSSSKAGEALGLDRGNILATCNGKYKHCGGFRWGRNDDLPDLKQRKLRIYEKTIPNTV